MRKSTFQCESCGDQVPESEAYTETEMGYRETITLAFCPECMAKR